MIEISIRDLIALFGALSGGLCAWFLLKGRIALLEQFAKKHEDHSDRIVRLEESMKGYSKAIERVFSILERIEEKLDTKADR